MKRCSKCGRILSEDCFAKKTSAKDGLQYNCKSCQRELCRRRYHERKRGEVDSIESSGRMAKVFTNPQLASFTPRQLMEELKARGFRWEYMLEPQRRIMFDKI